MIEADCGIYAATHNPRKRGWIKPVQGRHAGRIVLEYRLFGGHGPRAVFEVETCKYPGYERFIGRVVDSELLTQVNSCSVDAG